MSYSQTLGMTLDSEALSADLDLRITYDYTPASGPIWSRGEPLPISPADPPEIDIHTVEAVRQQTTTRRCPTTGRVLSQETRIGEYVDITKTFKALLTGDDWNSIAERLLESHGEAEAEFAREMNP